MSDFLSALTDFIIGTPPVPKAPTERATISRSAKFDVLSDLARSYEEARQQAPRNRRAAAAALLEQLKLHLKGPTFCGPRRKGERMSAKKRRALGAEIDRIIREEGK